MHRKSCRDKPFEPSKYPDAGSYRVCEVARFKTSSKTFTFINTHLDDRSDAQRRLAASMLLARARYDAHSTSAPVIVTGDFNSAARGYDSGAYQIATGAIPPVPMNETFAEKYRVPETQDEFVLRDLKAETPRMRISGDFATFTGFNRPGDASVYTRIDFVFGGSNGGWWVPFYIGEFVCG